MESKLPLLSVVLGSLALGACGSIAPEPSAFQARAPISAIDTNQAQGLRCLGRLIDAAPRGPVEVVSRRIRDHTVPRRFEDRRLSKGGEWWIHTAIAKMNTHKVSSLESDSGSGAVAADRLEFQGAWTQDDRVGVEGESEINAMIGNVAFSLFGGTEYDLIVGDFTTAKGGRVIYASAVGVVVSAGSAEADLFVRDGQNSYAFSIGGGVTEGPQMAQRQITEAAVAVHLASYYEVDYQSCFVQQADTPDRSASFDELSPRTRHLGLQQALKTLGHYEGEIDGLWGPQSAAALKSFATDARLPESGRPTAELYRAARNAAKKASQSS